MKILEISYRNPHGKDSAGVESYILKLSEFLIMQNNTVDIVYAGTNKNKSETSKEIYIPEIIRKTGLSKFYYNLKLISFVRSNSENYDIIHINGDNGVLVPYILGIKTIMTLHGSITESAKVRKKYFTLDSLLSYTLDTLDGLLEKIACRNADKVIAVSEHVAKYFQKTRKKDTIAVINTCIQAPQNAKVKLNEIEEIKKMNKILALWVGRDPVRKGLYIAKDAVKNLNDIELITVGYYDKNVQDNVINLGYVDNQILYTLYQIADLMIFPSINEGFSSALLEAMSYGCIPLAFRIPSTEELIENNHTGFLVTNQSELRDKLILLAQNKEIMEQMKSNIIFKAEDYNCDKILPKIYAIFEELYNS